MFLKLSLSVANKIRLVWLLEGTQIMSAGFLRGPPLTCSPNFVAQGEPNELTLCATT